MHLFWDIFIQICEDTQPCLVSTFKSIRNQTSRLVEQFWITKKLNSKISKIILLKQSENLHFIKERVSYLKLKIYCIPNSMYQRYANITYSINQLYAAKL